MLEDRDWGGDKFPSNSEHIGDLLFQLDAHKAMGLMGFIPGCSEGWLMLWQDFSPLFFSGLGNVESSQSTGSWQANVVPVFEKGKEEDAGHYKPVSLTSVPGKIMEKIILGLAEKHFRDKAVIGHEGKDLLK